MQEQVNRGRIQAALAVLCPVWDIISFLIELHPATVGRALPAVQPARNGGGGTLMHGHSDWHPSSSSADHSPHHWGSLACEQNESSLLGSFALASEYHK